MFTLKNRSLATKISFPPLVVIVLSLMVTFYTWNGLQQVVDELTSITQFRIPQAAVTEQLAKSVLRSKEIVSNFLSNQDENEIARMQEQHQIIEDNFRESKSLNFSPEDRAKLQSFIEVYENYYGLVVNDIKEILAQTSGQLDHIKNVLFVGIIQQLHKLELQTEGAAASYSAKAKIHVLMAVSAIESYNHGLNQIDFDMMHLELDAAEDNLYYLGKSLRTMTGRRAVKSLVAQVQELRTASDSIYVFKQQLNTLLTVDLLNHSTELGGASDELMQKIWKNVRGSTESSLDLTSKISLTSIIIASVAILFGAMLSLLIIRAISRPIREAVVVANGIAEGNLSQNIKTYSNDETGQLLSALAKMQNKIKSQLDEITLSAKESQRIKIGLDNASSSIMLTDHEHNIIFLNKSLIKQFHEFNTAFSQQVDQFDPDRLMGRKFDMFSKQSEHMHSVFSNMSDSQSCSLEFGEQKYRLSADPVFDENQHRLGAVVQWDNVTAQLQMETEVKHMIGEAKSGNLGLRLSLADKSGFYKTLSEEINDLVSVSESVINDAVDTLGSISNGDLMHKANSEYKGSYATLNNNINNTIDKLIGVISSIKNTSQAVDEGARHISEGNGDLSRRTQVQSAELDQSARSMSQISTNVNESARNAEHANELALAASEKARAGGSVLALATNAMEEINHASLSIRDIISVMDEIAFQTNLLALNASVEAAHAGDLGRGFAVVADEVRSLAQRSADAAKEIKVLINDTVTKVDDGARLVTDSSDSLNEIIESVSQVSSIIHDISNASAEQSNELEAVSKSIEQLDGSNQENAAMVEQTATASESLQHQAGELTELINFFSIENGASKTSENTSIEIESAEYDFEPQKLNVS